ncbi:MAG TPA: dethiobiotin synthase, partial [Thermoleophilaceae bacterium]
EVGKTVVAAVLARTLANSGERVAVFKPAVTGIDEFADDGLSGEDSTSAPLPDHDLLRLAAGSEQSDEEIAPYRYGPPASPHLAAAQADEEIDPKLLRSGAQSAAASADVLVCEGVGGLLVPLVGRLIPAMREESAPYLVRDLAVELGLPVIIAASPGLGTINHTLLTLESARAAGLSVAAVVLTPWPEEPSAIERSNRETIESLGEVSVLTLTQLDLAAPETWPALSIKP